MVATPSLEFSGILPTSFLLLHLTVMGSVCITGPEGGGDIPAMTTNLKNPPNDHIEIHHQQKSRRSPVASVHGSPTPLRPPEALAVPGKPWTIKTENRISFHLMGFERPRLISPEHIDVPMDEITKTVWNSGHSDPARHKREADDQGATGEASTKPPIIGNTTFLTESSTNMYTDASTVYAPSERSTVGNMYLCDHPPKKFSPSFHGSSREACLQYDTKWEGYFRDTRNICNRVFSLTEANPEALTIVRYQSEVGPLKVIAHKNYVKICLPLFRRFNKCEERKFLTICWDDRVVFFHSSICPQFFNDLYLASFLLDNNTECFQEFCEGRQSVVDSEIGGLVYRLTNVRHSLHAPNCGYMTKSLKHIYREYNGTLYLVFNRHWPCCYPQYLVIWAGLPEDHGLNGAWSYLPAACQAGEVLLLVFVGCVMVGSIVGNLLVVMVMLNGGHRSQESSLLRTSLAFSNLLTATFVIVPSFVQHLSPFFSTPDYIELTPGMKLTFEPPVNVTSKILVTNSSRESGFRVFQSLLFHVTSTASLLMLMVLSVERFVITGRYLRYKDYFTYCRTLFAITASWITSLGNALWLAAHDGGGLSAERLTFEKLPTGASGHGPGGIRNVIYHGQFLIFLLLGLTVVTFSGLAIKNFVKQQIHVAKEWKSLKMKASRQFSEDNWHVLTTMSLMFVLFLTSTIPLATNIVFNSIAYTFPQQTLFSYLAWWLFMAACAWNPWVYNFRSHQFKEDLTNFRCHVLQTWRLKKWLGAEESQTMPATSLPSASYA
ncbi:hypothetical protein GWK47_043504 [Chionoecetes opilio]|uniref:G-protein coupled receptors family 1 profile domain-containing protein n=1 Tax=Chionoecetes opilio TaxID=41210 RepID=A0A8J4YAA0_CHIOP|nr:hypothetical protein GWK47_043504 [Chionoecetes opilio]